ncbi:MAG: hypothetical protein SFV81_13880, partial [Pirellulaceae bacterium]|nr:hypothetical protein [Pirellulaceae bacterium]
MQQHSGRETVHIPAARGKIEGSCGEIIATGVSQFPGENVALTTVYGEELENSGGGIRTPDTRIMIP